MNIVEKCEAEYKAGYEAGSRGMQVYRPESVIRMHREELEQFIIEKINPIVGRIFNAGKLVGGMKDSGSMEMTYLHQGTEAIKQLLTDTCGVKFAEDLPTVHVDTVTEDPTGKHFG